MFFWGGLEACALHFPWPVSPQPPVSWPLLAAHMLWDWPVWPAPENRTLTDTSSFKRLAFLIPRGQFCQKKAFQLSADEGGVLRVCVCVWQRVCFSWAGKCLRLCFCCLSLRLCCIWCLCPCLPSQSLSARWQRHSCGSLISNVMYESFGF